MAFFSSRKNLVGLDIGSYAIKACSIRMGNRGPVLGDFGILRLPLDQDFSDPSVNREALARHVRQLLDNLRINPKEVATSISGFSVIIKQLSLPYSTKKELMANLEWEAEQHIPFGVQDVTMDVHVVGPNKEKENHTDVILVAAKNEHVQAIVDLLDMAKLTAGVIDVDMFALENAYDANYPYEEGCTALIDIGASQLKINVLREGVSIFTREVSQGGHLINQKIRHRFQVDPQKAEHIKLFAEAPDGRTAELKEIFEEAAIAWSMEVKRAFDFVASAHQQEGGIRRILLAGGCALMPGFPEFLQDRIGVPVELFDAFQGIGVDSKRFDPDYLRSMAPIAAVSVGLALRKVGDS